jgi:transcriptional regulator with XRE-family HTH domain
MSARACANGGSCSRSHKSRWRSWPGTFRQVYNYERGITGVGSGHLYRIAQVLGVEVGFFFEGTGRGDTFTRVQGRRLLLELGRNFVAIPVRRHKEEIVSLARALAAPDNKATPAR